MPKSHLQDERGAILLWMGIMMIAFLGIAAVAVDLGAGYASKRKMSAVADSAALAGAQEAGLKFLSPTVNGCGPNLTSAVTTAAHANYAANAPQGSTGNPPVTVTCFGSDGAVITSGTNAARVEVKVDTSATLDTYFGRVLGVASLKPAATATAAVEGNRNQTGLRPFLVCVTDAQDARKDFTTPQTPSPRPFQSYYAKFDQKVPLPGAPIVNNGVWESATGVVKANDHGLAVNDYVLLDVNVSGGADYYYVKTETQNTFTLARTFGGDLVKPPVDQVVDIYPPPAPVLTGASWAASTGLISPQPASPLQNGTVVQVTLGQNVQAVTLEGKWTVVEADLSGFKLSNGTSTLIPSSTVSDVSVRLWSIPGGSGACNPGTSPANWGYSAFDLPSGNNNQLDCLIEFGYGGDAKRCADADPSIPGVDVGAELAGTPAEGDQGNNLQPSSQNLIKALIDKKEPILLPVGNNWVASGNNANYDGRGALAVQLCGYAFPGSQPLTTTDKYFPEGNGYCGNNQKYIDAVNSLKVTKETSLVIQWIYADWVPGYQGAPTDATASCTLDQCLGQLRLVK